MTTRRTVLGGMAASLALVSAPGRAAASIDVVTTVAMIGDAVRAIGGDRVTLTSLMGAGVDPHAYRQTRSDIAAMTAADLVLWNGLYLEAQLEEFLQTLGRKVPVRAVAEAGVPVAERIAHEDYAGEYDPHVWMVPAIWRGAVRAVRDALIEIDPDGRATYDANHAAYDARLAELDRYARETLATVPAESRVLITAHDAFGYFGKAYGFEVLGIQGISTTSEAGLKRIDDLVSLIVERKISAVFVESSVSDRNMRALIEGAAAAGQEVSIGGQLFSDAMGVPGSYEGTYPGMIDHNATVIARALGGTAPERGMAGRLSLEVEGT